MLGDFGSNVCPAGSAGIGTEVACQARVATLGFVYVRSLSNSAYPKGCYGNGTHAWLNTHATGNASATRQRICQPVASCNDTVFVDGAGGSQSDRMGYYYLVEGLVQGGRPVYKYEPAEKTPYLFYWASSGRWLIGADYTSSGASLRAQSSAACPDAATGWQVLSNSSWTSADWLVVTAGRSEDCPARWSCSLAPTNLVALETNNEKRGSAASSVLLPTGPCTHPAGGICTPSAPRTRGCAHSDRTGLFCAVGRYLQPLHRRVGWCHPR